jgi:sugar phosphate permease
LLGLDPSLGFGAIFFVIARATEGFLQATGWSGTLTMTSDWFGAAHRGAVMGVMSTNSNVGNIVGEIIVGSVLEILPGAGGWQMALFILAGLLGLMGYVNSRRLVYPPPLEFELPADQQNGIKDQKDAMDLADSDSSAADCPKETPLGIIEACKIPGVIAYALSYCFLKLVTYSLLFWLPFYLFEGAGLCKSLAALMATLNDVGMVLGGITAGWLSDVLTHKAGVPVRTPIVVAGLLAAILPIGLLTISTSPLSIGILITLAGFFLGMPAECSTSAVCIDLAKSQPKAATATVIGIIDGTGALGAAAGQQMVSLSSTKRIAYQHFTLAGGAVHVPGCVRQRAIWMGGSVQCACSVVACFGGDGCTDGSSRFRLSEGCGQSTARIVASVTPALTAPERCCLCPTSSRQHSGGRRCGS